MTSRIHGDDSPGSTAARLSPQLSRLPASSPARISGVLLYVLAAYISVTSALSLVSTRLQPAPTVLGIGLLIAAAIIMPLLGRAKKKLAAKTASRALRADAAQSNICACMSGIALAALLVNFFVHLPWADSAAALLCFPMC